MATPTAMAASKPPAQAVATPPVSTPFSAHNHPAFSPHGPRSVVPSPQQVKKSPANSNTLYGYPSVSAAGYDSPSAAMALGGSGLVDLGLDMGAVGGMTPGMSHGMTSGMGPLGPLGRANEDERKRRLAAVMDVLKVGDLRS